MTTFFRHRTNMLTDLFNRFEVKMIDVPCDGDCLFHAIHRALCDSPTTPQSLRKLYADAIYALPNVFRAFCHANGSSLTKKQAASMASKKTFLPSSDCVAFLSQILDVAIIVVAAINTDLHGFTEVIIYEPHKSSKFVVLFLNLSGSHYEVITSNNETEFDKYSPFISALYASANYTVLKVPEKLLL